MNDSGSTASHKAGERFAAGCPERLAAANISPVTGLSTDYLNHFGEAIMLLDLAGQAPEYQRELRRWRPQTYREYFSASQLAHRRLSIAAYEQADELARQRFDALCLAMNVLILAAHPVAAGSSAQAGTRPAADVVRELKSLFARASAAVHGREAPEHDPAGPAAANPTLAAAP